MEQTFRPVYTDFKVTSLAAHHSPPREGKPGQEVPLNAPLRMGTGNSSFSSVSQETYVTQEKEAELEVFQRPENSRNPGASREIWDFGAD